MAWLVFASACYSNFRPFGIGHIALSAAYILARGVLNFVGGNCVFILD